MKIEKPVVKLTGTNILLTTMDLSDEALKTYCRWMNDETISQWIGHNDKILHTEEEIKKYKDSIINHSDREYNFDIVLNRVDNELIGDCSIKVSQNRTTGVIGIVIGETSYLGKGFGTEAVKMLVNYGFEQLNLHRMRLDVVAGNERARKCYEKAGFRICGTEHEAVYYDGHYDDIKRMEILRQDYELNLRENYLR